MPPLPRSIPRILSRSFATPVNSSQTASATAPTPSSPFNIFDRRTKLHHRTRAALNPSHSRLTDYVKDEVAAGMVDRLMDIKKRYGEVVELGSGAGHISKLLEEGMAGKVLMTDSCEKMLRRDEGLEQLDLPVTRQVMDEELLEFEENSHDCIMSSCALHWVNDLPGTLIQIRKALKPDGVFIGAMIGGDTLFELRTAMQLAELEREGGISPRVSPMTGDLTHPTKPAHSHYLEISSPPDSQSLSSLMSRAGFALPTIDLDEITIRYPSMFELVEDLRLMGETNAIANRRSFMHRDTLLSAAAIYAALHGTPANPETGEPAYVPATFQVVYVIGWKPDPSQPKPAKRGSGDASMKSLGQSGEL